LATTLFSNLSPTKSFTPKSLAQVAYNCNPFKVHIYSKCDYGKNVFALTCHGEKDGGEELSPVLHVRLDGGEVGRAGEGEHRRAEGCMQHKYRNGSYVEKLRLSSSFRLRLPSPVAFISLNKQIFGLIKMSLENIS